MRASSKKNTTHHSKPHPSQGKGLPRSKSTEQLAPRKAGKRGREGEEANRSQTLIKCKSTKSLKGKSVGKGSQQGGKRKGKKGVGARTVKKGATCHALDLESIRTE